VELLELVSDDDNGARIRFSEASMDGNKWNFGGGDGNTIFMSDTGDGAEFILTGSGNLTITGTLTENSDVNAKENFAAIDPQQILALASELPLLTWSYKEDETYSRHLGPMAQDFYAAFGLGASENGIAPRNLAAVTLAALQGLNQVVESQNAELRADNARLAEQNAELLARLEALEALVQNGMDR
jgi:hypothetical protein